MKKYLVAAVLVAAFAGPALAEQFYVAFDPASHKCTMMHSQPAAPMKSMGGPFNVARQSIPSRALCRLLPAKLERVTHSSLA